MELLLQSIPRRVDALRSRLVKVLVIGAGQVGTAVVAALHASHDVTVLELDSDRLAGLSYRFDVLPVRGSGTARADLLRAGVRVSDLVIAAADRDETNIVAGMMTRSLSDAKVVVRTRTTEFIDAWRNGHLDVDHIVSSELETAQAVARAIGYPTAIQTDVFASGRVELVEFVIDASARSILGVTIAAAGVPDESVVASIIRGERVIIPSGADRIELGDRIVLIASPAAARTWAQRLAPDARDTRRVVVIGGGATGVAVAAQLVLLGIGVRVIERDGARAARIADELPGVRVFHADGTDVDFLRREHVGETDAVVCCTGDDARDLLISLVCRSVGTRTILAVVGDPAHIPVFLAAGVDLALNERQVTAEEIVRFTHDPRTTGLAMLENDLAEVLEIEVRPTSRHIGRPFRDRPFTGAIVGAIIRGDRVIFPRGDDALAAGDRAIIFAEAARVAALERAL